MIGSQTGGWVLSYLYKYKALLVMSPLLIRVKSSRVESSQEWVNSFGHMSDSRLGKNSRLAHISGQPQPHPAPPPPLSPTPTGFLLPVSDSDVSTSFKAAT